MIDLGPRQCAFPITPYDARQHLFCGDPVSIGSPYCVAHHAVARKPLPATLNREKPE